MSILFTYASKNNVALGRVLTDWQSVLQPPAIALLYAPNWCRFALLNGKGELFGFDGAAIKPDPVYEARVFNQHAELRWLNEAECKGKAVFLTEAKQTLADYDDLGQLKPLRTIDQTYLLWGEGVEVTAIDKPETGWSRLTTARIGRLNVPLGANEVGTGRVQLVAREYLAEVDDHGNVAVVEERLIGLEPAS